MNVRIFWVRAMECMCAQTRPRFILSSERVFWGNGVWTHVNSKRKIPSTGKFPQKRIEPATLWTASPNTTNELFRPSFARSVCRLPTEAPAVKQHEKVYLSQHRESFHNYFDNLSISLYSKLKEEMTAGKCFRRIQPTFCSPNYLLSTVLWNHY